MQEFDFTNTDMADDLSEMAEHLSQEEATAAIAAIKALRDIQRWKILKTGLIQPSCRF